MVSLSFGKLLRITFIIYQDLQRVSENKKLDPMGPMVCRVDSFFCMSIFQLKQFLGKEIEITKNYWAPITIFKALYYYLIYKVGLPDGKESTCNAGDTGNTGLIPGSGRPSRRENGYPLQYSCLENPIDRGAWWATVQRVPKSQTQLSE